MSSKNELYTEKQGQYLAFIFYYTKLNGVPPAHLDFQRYFSVTAPTVHQTIIHLEQKNLISRKKNTKRSIALNLSEENIPRLK